MKIFVFSDSNLSLLESETLLLNVAVRNPVLWVVLLFYMRVSWKIYVLLLLFFTATTPTFAKMTEAVVWRCSVKNVPLKMSWNLQENTWLKFFKKILQNRCLPVYFQKFVRTLILYNIYELLLLRWKCNMAVGGILYECVQQMDKGTPT